MIELKHISKSYNGMPVLQNISMTFRDNGCYCLMSPSGSGKTTLMRILMGLEKPDTGTIGISVADAGRNVDTRDSRDASHGRTSPSISAVFQEDRLCESFSPLENVTMCAGRSIKASRVRWEMGKLLPEECLDRPVSTLSGGMKRRVAVYRALLTPSDILIMDEPFTGMDEELKHSVIAYIREKRDGRILILSTHQEEDVKLIGGELVRLA